MVEQKKILKQLVELAKINADIEVIWLYGSRVGGLGLEHSDFDIAIAFKNFQLSTVDTFLRPNTLALDWSSRLSLPSSMLSIVDISLVPIYLAYNIINDGEIIYQADTCRAFTEQNRIYSKYEYYLIESRRDEE